jgi:2-(1,2-epoxy-1,2-dihydrophenyl)acetyl-CoA isomerase
MSLGKCQISNTKKMEEQGPILFEKEGFVGKITFNRPDALNSFTREMALSCQAALDACQQDEEIRAVLITGAGNAFCAGQDLKEVIAEDGPSLTTILIEHFNPIIMRIRELQLPVVAAVSGVAAGAGANIALACDIVVASHSSKFIQAFSKIGLVPDSGGTFHLPRLVGLQKATALMMLGDSVSAEEAERMGMIYKAIPDEDFEAEVSKMVEKLSNMPTRALAMTKRALNYAIVNSDLEKQLAMEDQFQSEAGMTEDFKEGVQAFLEKRKPIFKGK